MYCPELNSWECKNTALRQGDRLSIKGDRKATSKLGPEATWHGPSDTTTFGHNRGIAKGTTVFWGIQGHGPQALANSLANWKQKAGRRGSGFSALPSGPWLRSTRNLAQSKYEGGGPQAIWATRALVHFGEYEDIALGHQQLRSNGGSEASLRHEGVQV